MRLPALLLALVGGLAGGLAPAPAAAQLIENNVAGRATPPLTTDKQNLLLLDLSTGGRVTIWLRPDVAPKMVERVKTLARRHFYDGLLFHRVIDGFMAQGGDPKGDGSGGSELPNVPAEFNYLPHVRGAVSAAREGAAENADAAAKKKAEDSANSQFFVVFQPRLSLDKEYTVFGRVIDGMQYVDTIERGEPPANPSRIVHAYVAADNPPAFVAPPPSVPVTLGAPVTLPGVESSNVPAPSAAAPGPRPAARRPTPRQTPRRAPARR